MNLLVLGASGGCGRWVSHLASQRGCRVTAAVRPGSARGTPAGVHVREGQVLDEKFLAEVIPGHDIVVSCLGLRRRWISPYSRLLSPRDLVERVMRRTTPIMAEHGMRRLVVISAGGVGSSRAQTSFAVRRLVSAGNLGVAYRDLERMEQHLATTSLDWLAVRPVTLVNGDPDGRARPVTRYGLFSTIRRANVAAWIVGHLEESYPGGSRTVLLGC